MKIITLKRVCMTDILTCGVMIEEGDPKIPFCLTLELPWKSNLPNISCIPKGEYLCKKVDSPSRGLVFEVQDVPNRSHILIHKGNWTTDTLGCIILGEMFEQTLNAHVNRVVTSVMSSGKAFNEFMKIVMHGQDSFTLVIEQV